MTNKASLNNFQGPQGSQGTQGAQGTSATFSGSSTDLTAGDGSVVTVGTGLTLSSGVLSASGGGGGITQLTGSAEAGPGSGSVTAYVRNIDGKVNGYYSVATAFSYASAINWQVSDPNVDALSARLSIGGNGNPNGAFSFLGALSKAGDGLALAYFGTDWASNRCETAYLDANRSVSYNIAGTPTFRNGRGGSADYTGYNAFINQSTVGLIESAQVRVTGSSYTCDLNSISTYWIEVAIGAGSGGTTINLPIDTGIKIANAAAVEVGGRTIKIVDVSGTISNSNPINVVDPNSRTFNGVAGPFIINKPNVTVTLVLDSTMNNWVCSFQGSSPGASFSGTSSQLTAGDGSAITVGSTLALSGGVLNTNDISCRVTSSTSQTITDTASAVAFDVEEYDTASIHDTVTNNTQFVIPSAGKYVFTANVRFATDSGGVRKIYWRLNGGATTFIGASAPGISSFQVDLCSTFERSFSTSDYVELMAVELGILSVDIESAFVTVRKVA